MTWPRPGGDWDCSLETIEAVFANLAAVIAADQPLTIAAPADAAPERLGALVAAHGGQRANLTVAPAPADDVWSRDHGPLTVTTAEGRLFLDFRFNGWGGKYPSAHDDAVTASLWRQGALGPGALCSEDAVLEGGAIDGDGEGTLLATRRCLMHPGRNPGCDSQWYEALLARELGVRRVLWLDHGALVGDDTDGHVDMLARFTAADTIAYTACDDPDDPCYDTLRDLAAELATLRRADGQPYRLVPLPWPGPIHDSAGDQRPATYANFLVTNTAVLVPAYGVAADTAARRCLGELFPGRNAVSVDSRLLITQGGSLHCATMQIPSAVA